MACYCGKITSLYNELRELEIAEYLANSMCVDTTFTYINNSAMHYESGFSLEKQEQATASDIRQIYNGVYTAVGDVRSAIQTAKSSVNWDIKFYQSLDTAYHAQED